MFDVFTLKRFLKPCAPSGMVSYRQVFFIIFCPKVYLTAIMIQSMNRQAYHKNMMRLDDDKAMRLRMFALCMYCILRQNINATIKMVRWHSPDCPITLIELCLGMEVEETGNPHCDFISKSQMRDFYIEAARP